MRRRFIWILQNKINTSVIFFGVRGQAGWPAGQSEVNLTMRARWWLRGDCCLPGNLTNHCPPGGAHQPGHPAWLWVDFCNSGVRIVHRLMNHLERLHRVTLTLSIQRKQELEWSGGWSVSPSYFVREREHVRTCAQIGTGENCQNSTHKTSPDVPFESQK